jgi:hypothetical protein
MSDERPWFELTGLDELIALPTDELSLRILIQMGHGPESRVTAVNRVDSVPLRAKPSRWLWRLGGG